ncbi:hypothetical protein HPP92_009695 [Vanilla planifolia]|uniref:Uncharacterized protein n=1 Tax=Vanilla planifolia TaxID=51239 RepID=A0A835R4P7_VANPL|nr:hypothetical protein HPP92_009695 [Vanilla planifolia]
MSCRSIQSVHVDGSYGSGEWGEEQDERTLGFRYWRRRVVWAQKPVIPNGLVVFRAHVLEELLQLKGLKKKTRIGISSYGCSLQMPTTGKLICARLKQSSGDFGSFFTDMNFKNAITESIAGDLHLLCLRGTFTASEITADPSRSSKHACTSSLDLSMKVQILAVLPTTSSRAELVCISDGKHSVHLMSVDNENPAEKGDNDEVEKLNMLSGSAHDRTFSYRTSSSWSRKDICIFHFLMISKSWLI